MTVTEYEDTWEEDVIPPVVHVAMKNILVPTKKQPLQDDPPLSQKMQITTTVIEDLESTDEESEESSFSHVDTVPTEKRRIFRCLMQVLFPFRRTMTTEEFFASFRRPKQDNGDTGDEQSLSDISILALPEEPIDDPPARTEPRSRRRLFRGRRVARSRRTRGWQDSVATQVTVDDPERGVGLATLGEEEVAF